AGAKLTAALGSDNIAFSSVDTETGQVIAMVGSIDYNAPGYGQTNAATSPLEPGSSIKPVVDYAPLFTQREGVNYGPGAMILDNNIDNIYCAGNTSGRCGLSNASNKLYGNITIRNALGNSLNIPAVKALIINNSNDRGQYVGDIDNSLDILHKLGDISYCDGIYAGLSSGIGGGCSVRPIEHANAFASLARGGAYRPLAYTLEVKNSVGDILQSWEDSASTQVVDPQVAYMITNILSDPAARSLVFGSQGYSFGFKVPDVWTASKTGTTDNGNGAAKDAWFVSYSPVVATSVWNGNHDGAPLSTSTNDVTRRVVNNYMEAVHKEVYAIGKTGSLGGKWSPNQEIAQPAGIQRLTIAGRTDVYPSWYNQKTSGGEKVDMEFDSVSKKLATEYTPAATRVTVSVTKIVDPVSGKETLYAEDGYDPNSSDDVHTAATSGTLSIPTGLVYSGGFLTATAVDTEYNLVSYSLKSSQGTYLVQDHAFGVSETHTGQISYQLTSSHAGETVTLTVTNEAGYTTSMSTLIPY
ncbi:MAG: hypothetical protein LBM97_00200, partial [Candidatus Nomurabacteria bacterium]|nr:hypothetical protein [Candidatus Nomurabacteria bacterium]